MNPIKAIINDFKTDIQFLKKISSGEYKFPYTLREVIDIRPMLKDPKTYVFFMIIIIAVIVGTQISAKHYQKMANEEIIETHYYINKYCLGNTEYTPIGVDFIELMKEINKTGSNTAKT